MAPAAGLQAHHSNVIIGHENHNGLMVYDVDALRIKVTGIQMSAPWNRLYRTDSDKSRVIYRSYGHGATYVGQSIRISGFLSGTAAGEVTKLRFWFIGNYGSYGIRGAWQYGFRLTAGSLQSGDSGGTVWVSDQSRAILLGEYMGGYNANDSFFTHQKDIRWALDITPCFTDSCT